MVKKSYNLDICLAYIKRVNLIMQINAVAAFFVILCAAMGDVTSSLETKGLKTSSSENSTSVTNTAKKLILSNKKEASERDGTAMRLLFEAENNRTVYVDANFQVAGNDIGLRLDFIQPDLWVLDGDTIEECSVIDSWWSSEISVHGTNLPDLLTTEYEYTATVCGQDGLFLKTSLEEVEPTRIGVSNGDPYDLPYLNAIDAAGVFDTGNVSFLTSEDKIVNLANFTFIDVDKTNVFVGGIGLAGSKSGLSFLDSLVSNNYLISPGYSVRYGYNGNTSESSLRAEVILGGVDKNHISGQFLAFDIPDVFGEGFPIEKMDAIEDLVLPILPLKDISVTNQKNGVSISLKENNEVMPILLDPRTNYNILPLDVIINLALQTNAYYSSEIRRWIVECDAINLVDASVDFTFGNLTITVPLQKLISKSGFGLKFSNQRDACILNVLPTSFSGYVSLGISFLTSVYLAVDNKGGQIAIAQVNSTNKIESSSLLASDRSFLKIQTRSSASSSNSSLSTFRGTFALIESSHIPFAYHYTYTSNLTFTYTTLNASVENKISIPARLSGLVKSGEINVSHAATLSNEILPQFASPASSTQSRSDARRINPFGFTRFYIEDTITCCSLILGFLLVLVLL